MTEISNHALFEKLDGLRTELVDLAFVLERQGRHDAADAAMTASIRVGELCDEFTVSEVPERNYPGCPE